MNNVYFDNAATTKVLDEAANRAAEMMKECYGNPSSLHIMGMNAENAIKSARETISSALFVKPSEIYFTGSGTEANNLAIFKGAALKSRRGNKIIASSIEHPSVSEPLKELSSQGFEVIYLPSFENGVTDISLLEKFLDENTILFTMMQINNETGASQPVLEAAEIIRKKAKNCLIHTDLIQSFCKTDFLINKNFIDLASISGHKVFAPKGVGALYVNEKLPLKPLMFGGGQEKGLRPGTENTPAIAAFEVAVKAFFKNKEENLKRVSSLYTYFKEKLLTLSGVTINGESGAAIINASFEKIRSEVLLHLLESNGIMVSSGSACSTNKPGLSKTLLAMGKSKSAIESSLRFSFSHFNTYEEIDYCYSCLYAALTDLRRKV